MRVCFRVAVVEKRIERVEAAVLRLVRLQMMLLANMLQLFIKFLLFWVNILFAPTTLLAE